MTSHQLPQRQNMAKQKQQLAHQLLPMPWASRCTAFPNASLSSTLNHSHNQHMRVPGSRLNNAHVHLVESLRYLQKESAG